MTAKTGRKATVDPATIEERQARAFELSLSGVSNVAIAKLVGVERRVVAADVKLEGQRRAQERAADRGALIDRSVARYELLIGAATLRQQALRNDALLATKWTAKARFDDLVRLEAIEIRKLQRQVEEVQGLHAPPILIDASTHNTVNALALATDNALAHYLSVPVETRTAWRRDARDDRNAQAIDVTPRVPDLRDEYDDDVT